MTPTCWLAVLLRKKLILLELTVTVMAEIEGEAIRGSLCEALGIDERVAERFKRGSCEWQLILSNNNNNNNSYGNYIL